MTQWTPELEKAIRKFAAYHEKQTKDVLDPEARVSSTILRMIFRTQAYGLHHYKKICRLMDMEYTTRLPDYADNTQCMIDLAEKNGSDAAAPLKKTLAVREALKPEFKKNNNSLSKIIKAAKDKKMGF